MNLNSIRKSIANENVSWGELAWLEDNKDKVLASGDIELAQWAGIPEEEFNSYTPRQQSVKKATFKAGITIRRGRR